VDIVAVRWRYIRGFSAPEASEEALPQFESLAALSSAIDIPLRTLERHSASENWSKERLAYQAQLGARLREATTRRLSYQQSAVREAIHAGARFLVSELLKKVRNESLSVFAIAAGMRALKDALAVTTAAADPDAGKETVAAQGDCTWSLLRGTGPRVPQSVIDATPLEIFDV
jgi:hypothetical protein